MKPDLGPVYRDAGGVRPGLLAAPRSTRCTRALVIVNPQREIVYVNRKAEAVIGAKLDEVQGRICEEALCCPTCRESCRLFEDGDFANVETEVHGIAGRPAAAAAEERPADLRPRRAARRRDRDVQGHHPGGAGARPEGQTHGTAGPGEEPLGVALKQPDRRRLRHRLGAADRQLLQPDGRDHRPPRSTRRSAARSSNCWTPSRPRTCRARSTTSSAPAGP